MNSRPLILLALTLAWAGCAPMVDQRDQVGSGLGQPEPKTETQLLREDLDILRQHIEALEQAQAQHDLAAPDDDQAIASLQSAVASLRTQIDELDRKQARQKQEIIDSLSARMAEVLKKQAASRPTKSTAPSNYTGAAREHTVQSGETLSAIAQAYGSSVDAIKRANNMGGTDLVRVGQKLVVPVKE